MDNKILQKKTFYVLVVTLLTMVMEIYYGIKSNSMGLTADGFHMGTHAIAFAITYVVCIIAIKYEDKAEKINGIGGLISSILLGVTAIGIIEESIERFVEPNLIYYDEAMLVAIVGLIVNIICALIMGDKQVHLHGHEHCSEKEKDENLNYKAAYMHIIADAMTSIFAIAALFCGKYMNLVYLDPLIGITGGIIIVKWSISLFSAASQQIFKKT